MVVRVDENIMFINTIQDAMYVIDDSLGYDFRVALEDAIEKAIDNETEKECANHYNEVERLQDDFRMTLNDIKLEVEALKGMMNEKRLNRKKIESVTDIIYNMIDNEL